MTSSRLALLAFTASAGLALATLAACSSSSSADDAGTGGLPAGCPSDPFADAGLDERNIDRNTYCQRYLKAMTDKANAMGCKLEDDAGNPLVCPKIVDDFEAQQRLENPGKCFVGYSQGTIENCECRIASYTACTDFDDPAKVCQFGLLFDPSETCDGDGGVIDTGADAVPETSAFDDADAGGGG